MLGPRIVTVYGKDGTKTRKPVGFPGSTCTTATLPYEARELPGQTRKTPTAEADEPEPQGVAVEERLTTEG